MRNIVGIMAVVLLFVGVALLMVTCGILDTPHTSASMAIPYAIATVAVSSVGAILANLYEGRRGNV